jgi:hypothetical protein
MRQIVNRQRERLPGRVPVFALAHERPEPGNLDDQAFIPQQFGCVTRGCPGHVELLHDLSFRGDGPLGLQLAGLDTSSDDGSDLPVARYRGQRIIAFHASNVADLHRRERSDTC